MPLPTSPFDAAESIFAGLSIIDFIPSGGVSTVFESRLLDEEPEQEEKALEMPDANGVLREVRSVLTKQKETYKFELVEPKRLLTIFGGALSGRVTGTVTLFIPDPDDAAGKVALTSESFACTITRDGGVKFGDADFTKATIKITSNKQGSVTWTADAAVPI